MKKNITINLCGRLFQIDEDAYELLQNYIESLHASFGRQEGGEEIADDIEERIAELFDELKANGTEALTIDHVKDIITRIGKPEQLTGGEEDAERTEDHSGKHSTAQDILNNVRARTAGKRLYRNPNDKMLAGVLSGFAAYTGTDATWWRIGYVLLLLGSNLFLGPLFKLFHLGGFFFSINMTLVLLYVILAFAMPEAKKPQQMLEMEGKDVTPQSLADVVVDEQQPQLQHTSVAREFFSVFMKIVLGFFVAIAFLIGIVLSIAFLAVLMTTIFALVMPASAAFDMPFTLGGMGLVEVWNYHPLLLIGFTLALLVVLFIPVYAITHMILSLSKRIRPMGVAQRIVCIVLWLIALGCVIPLGSTIASLHDQYGFERRAERDQWMTDYDRAYLKSQGWLLEKNENCHNDYVKNGEYFSGDRDVPYLDVWDEHAQQVFQVKTTIERVEAGNYRLICNARAEGQGVYIYVTTPDRITPIAMTMVPVYGNQGGKIWEDAQDKIKNDSLSDFQRQHLKEITDVNEGKGFGWSPVEVLFTIDNPSSITYGLTTDSSFTGMPYSAQWFSATDFKLERIEE